MTSVVLTPQNVPSPVHGAVVEMMRPLSPKTST